MEDPPWRCSVACEQTELRQLEAVSPWRCSSNSFGMSKKKSGEDLLFLRVRPDHTPPKWLSFGALRHRTRGHRPTPPSPSVPETGGLGLLLRLAEVSRGLAGWARRRPDSWAAEVALGGPGTVRSHPPPPGRRGTIPPISSWSMGPWAPGPLAEGRLAWAAPGWIRGRLAADGCRWRSLRCLPAPPLAVAAVQGELVLGWLSSPRLVAPVQLGQPFRVPSWSEEPHIGRQCGRVRPDHTPPKWLSFGALRHRTRSTMDEETEKGGPPSKTTLSGEHGRHSRAKSPEQQERADSPGPSCVSMKSDQSMDRPVKFKDGNLSIEKRRVQQERADSPGPSCVSMKSDMSKGLPVNFKDGNPSIEKRRVQQERADSPGPSCVSMKSDMSKGLPVNFKDGNPSIEKRRVQQERADSPGPSCVSMKSDQSMDRPVKFKDGNPSIEKRRVQQERADSPGPSCVSMKSDMSKGLPVNFKDGNPSIEKRRVQQERADSPVPSCVSMKSERSMHYPPVVKHGHPSREKR
ncbi:hypothetical protein N1851_005212 [Merluccius polli]|uniref:Uncharacterized protein n=1 Tax=Merluccius polli TaxID=89951 RepID=A0AA47PAE1_MERPO|nr:hypothetical protein N1851_005212 [Merluccius polli]